MVNGLLRCHPRMRRSMAFEDITDPEAVRRAIEEFKAIGQARFLEKYGFGASRGGCCEMATESMTPKPSLAQHMATSIRLSGPYATMSSMEACRPCRKLWRRAQDRLRRPQFHTLLTCGRPKQIASSRFCSHTVQRPAKPKPLRSHSMASKPWMVRRAVWKAWKQPTRGMGRLTRKWSLSIPCCRCLVT